MRIVFIGTPDFAVPSLERLTELDLTVCLVVTRPDARRGRGQRFCRSDVKEFALDKQLMVYQPQKLSSDGGRKMLEEIRPDIGVVVAFGEILAPSLIEMFPGGLLNVHASLLPKYRGAAPVNHALLNGEKYTGVTVQKVIPQVDAGPILAQKKTEILPGENAGELHVRLAELGAQCLEEVVRALKRGERIPEREQNSADASSAPKLSKKDGGIDWAMDAEAIVNRVRGLTPWPGAFCSYEGSDRKEKVTITQACHAGPVPEVEPGTIVDITEDEKILVAAGDGKGLYITALKPSGGRLMESADFVHGRHVAAGDHFI